jgi:2-desacetyl-2-hydroxyethyl bacteriochlorophyllide A dehydrogenase
MKTRCLSLEGLEKLALLDRELVLGDDEVLVQTHLAGICGTDKNFWRGYIPTETTETGEKPKYDLPLWMGHEGGGTVVAVGKKVSAFQEGDRVISFAWVDTFADYFKAKPEQLQLVPDGLNMDIACLGEPIGCAMFSGLNSRVQLGDTVVVFGLGFASQIIAQVCKRQGARRLIVVDVVKEKLDLAVKLGADIAIDASKEDPVAAVLRLTKGKGADVVVESAGVEQTINACSATVRHNGTMVFYAWVTQPVTLNIGRWHDDSLYIVNTGLVHHTIQERQIWTAMAMRPIIEGMVDVNSLITHEYKLADYQQAFRKADSDPLAIKVIMRP